MADRSELDQEATNVQKWMNGVDDGVLRQSSSPVEDTRWYLLSMKWFSQWKEFIGISGNAQLQDTVHGSQLPVIDNSDLLLDPMEPPGYFQSDDGSVYDQVIRPGLIDKVDYVILPKKAWKYLVNKYKCAKGSVLKRVSRAVSDYQTQIEISFQPVQVVFLPYTSRTKSIKLKEPKPAYFSRTEDIYDIRTRLKKIYKKQFNDSSVDHTMVKMWKLSADKTVSDLEQLLTDNPNDDEKILFPGTLLVDGNKLSESEFGFSDVLIFESKSLSGDWVFAEFRDMKCNHCNRQIGKAGMECGCRKNDSHDCVLTAKRKTCPECSKELPSNTYPCSCKKVICKQYEFCSYACFNRYDHDCKGSSRKLCPQCNIELPSEPFSCTCKKVLSMQYVYCSQLCYQRHPHYCPTISSGNHYNYSYNSYSDRVPTEEVSSSRKGRTGLQNLGNTCYMNSALQCLSHIRFLTQYFLHSNYEPDINLDNPLGSKGELVKAFAKVIKFLWFGTSSSYSPWEFKNAVSEFAQQFRGYEQHDSQELMSFILDGLHEDLNRVKSKPYVEELKFEGNPTDAELAEAYWTQHTMRNSSLIVDNMHGQYRSQVTCPTCKKTSLKFDPFLMLSVDLPPPLKKVEVCVMPYDLKQNGMIFAFAMDGEATVSMLKERMKEEYGPSDGLLFADVDDTKVKKVLDDYSQVPESEYKRMCVAYELPKQPLDSYTKVVLSIQKEERSYGYIRYTSCTSPRVLCILSGSTLKETHFAIFDFMYPMLDMKGRNEKRDWEQDSEYMEVDEDAEMSVEVNLKDVYTRLYDEVNQPYRYSNTSDNIYSVKTYNYNSQWNSKKSCYDPCPYCHQSHYTNCKLPFDDTLLSDFLQDQDADRILQLELACPPRLINSAFEKLPESHSSVERVEKQLDNRHVDSISLLECLEFTCKEKPLSADNMWFCPECKEHVMGSKKMTIYKLPRVLLIHLKRFKQGEYTTLKNEKRVDFPIEGLDMSPFLQSEQRQCTQYDLIAVNEHSGSLGFGHYTAHAKDEDGWVSYNDSYTSSTYDPLSSIVTSNAYVLFYESNEI